MADVALKRATIAGQDRVLAISRDITERKQAEEALRESEKRFRTLSEASFEGIGIHDRGRILEGNQALAAMFGYELSEVIGMHALDLTAPESRDTVLQNILSGYPERYELTGLRKDGSTFPVEVCGRAISYQGRTARVAAIRDITEHKQAEEALQKAREELEARVERQMERGNPYGLTFRELTVLHVVAAGKADKEIGTPTRHQHSDGQQAPREHPQQDGRRLPHRGMRARPARRTARLAAGAGRAVVAARGSTGLREVR